jgi:hypothetical protein
MRIDAHLLTWDTPPAWRAACLASLQGAPIVLHETPGIRGNMGQARCNGYAFGSLPLVSWVDPDDIYHADAFTRLADALDANPHAAFAYSDENLISESGQLLRRRRLQYNRCEHLNSASHVHGVIVMRRALVERCLNDIRPLNVLADWAMSLLLAKLGPALHVPVIGRDWRQHAAQGHAGANDPVFFRDAMKFRHGF